MRHTVIALIIVGFLTTLLASNTLNPKRKNNAVSSISKNVRTKCNKLSKTKCNINCKDGWIITGYYRIKNCNPNKVNKNTVKLKSSNVQLIAMYTSGICNRCYTRFAIRKNKSFREVSCDEFYQHIEDAENKYSKCIQSMKSKLPAKGR